MPDEVNLPAEQGTETTTPSEAPKDFREYTEWRRTGELPDPKEDTPAAAGLVLTETQAETEPDSEPENTQDAGEDNEPDDGGRKKRLGPRERKLERALAEIEELKRQVSGQSVKPTQEPSEPAAAGKPKLEDFPTLEAYQEALTDWKLDQRERKQKETEARTAAEEKVRAEQDSWAKREKAARKAHDDYDDLMDTVVIPAGPGVLAARQAIIEDEHGAELLYYLAKNPKELERIAGLSPASAALAIGKLSAKFDITPATENGKPKITGAPKPPPPSGRPSKTSSDTPEEAAKRGDFRAYTRLRAAQQR